MPSARQGCRFPKMIGRAQRRRTAICDPDRAYQGRVPTNLPFSSDFGHVFFRPGHWLDKAKSREKNICKSRSLPNPMYKTCSCICTSVRGMHAILNEAHADLTLSGPIGFLRTVAFYGRGGGGGGTTNPRRFAPNGARASGKNVCAVTRQYPILRSRVNQWPLRSGQVAQVTVSVFV